MPAVQRRMHRGAAGKPSCLTPTSSRWALETLLLHPAWCGRGPTGVPGAAGTWPERPDTCCPGSPWVWGTTIHTHAGLGGFTIPDKKRTQRSGRAPG